MTSSGAAMLTTIRMVDVDRYPKSDLPALRLAYNKGPTYQRDRFQPILISSVLMFKR